MQTEALIGRTRHYTALDGVRGFAALSVLAFHLGRWLDIPWLGANGGLSVDTFFTLSGYVLSLAYEKRIDSLTVLGFVAARLIRVMPMIVFAVAVSAPYVLFRSFVAHVDIPTSAIVLATLLGMLNLPYFYAPLEVGGPQLFPLNGPQYSLFLEVVANIVWWMARRSAQLSTMIVVSLACAATLIVIGIGGDTTETFWYGFPHVGASFALGIAVYHLDKRLPEWRGWPVAFWGLFAAMAALLFAPGEASFAVKLGWKCIIAPLLVLAAAHAKLGYRTSWLALQIGALSFPLYALHYPIFCWVNGFYRMVFGSRNALIEAPLIALVAITASLLALRFYDKPTRSYLTRKFNSREQKRFAVNAGSA
jgi:peptidoglycan/LPS O-acetylase OafA/YrhL